MAKLAATMHNTFVYNRLLIKLIYCEIRKLASNYFTKAIHNKIQSQCRDVIALTSS